MCNKGERGLEGLQSFDHEKMLADRVNIPNSRSFLLGLDYKKCTIFYNPLKFLEKKERVTLIQIIDNIQQIADAVQKGL